MNIYTINGYYKKVSIIENMQNESESERYFLKNEIDDLEKQNLNFYKNDISKKEEDKKSETNDIKNVKDNLLLNKINKSIINICESPNILDIFNKIGINKYGCNKSMKNLFNSNCIDMEKSKYNGAFKNNSLHFGKLALNKNHACDKAAIINNNELLNYIISNLDKRSDPPR